MLISRLKPISENTCFPEVLARKRTRYPSRRHQTSFFHKHATSAAAELGGKIRNVSRDPDRTQVPPQAPESYVYGSGTFGAFRL